MYSSAQLTGLGTPCFWALLCPEQFRFVYLPDSLQVTVGNKERPIRGLLHRRSLLEFIHPDEQCIAQADLNRFLRFRTLAGSITRCRLLSFQTIADRGSSSGTPSVQTSSDQFAGSTNTAATVPDTDDNAFQDKWEVVDIIMYIATESIILAFFHSAGHEDIDISPLCGDFSLTNHEIRIMLDILEEREQMIQPALLTENLRLFQIHASATGKFIASWPPTNGMDNNATEYQQRKLNEMLCETKSVMQKEILLLNSMNNSELQRVACRHPFQSRSLIHLSDGTYRFEHIIIPYGPITFGAFQITMVAPASTTCSDQGNIRHPKTTYRHYVHYNAPEAAGIAANSSGTNLTVPFFSLAKPNAKTNYNRSSSSSKQQGIYSSSTNLKHNSSTTLATLKQPPQHINSSSSSITMVRGVDSRMNSQFYMSVNQLLCPPNCTSVDLEEKYRSKLSPRFSYSPFPRSSEPRICAKCHTNTSPEWRKGPSGNKTLCNACGLRFSRLVAKQRRMSSHQRH